MKKLLTTPVAHRGLHGGRIPENSLPAFAAAVEAGYAIESDVRPTKDGKLVLFHDEDLLRLTGDPRSFYDCTYEELQALRLVGTEEKIPLLSDLLSLADGKVPILMEIKGAPSADTGTFIGAVAEAFGKFRGEYAIQSFHPGYVKAYKKLRPEIDCGVLATGQSEKKNYGNSPFWRIKAYAVKHMSLNFWVKPDFISFLFSDYPTKETEKFRGPKFAWTVRSEEDEAYARKYADNIIFEGYRAKK